MQSCLQIRDYAIALPEITIRALLNRNMLQPALTWTIEVLRPDVDDAGDDDSVFIIDQIELPGVTEQETLIGRSLWFLSGFSAEELAAFTLLDQALRIFFSQFPTAIPDVPDTFEDDAWQKVIIQSRATLLLLKEVG